MGNVCIALHIATPLQRMQTMKLCNSWLQVSGGDITRKIILCHLHIRKCMQPQDKEVNSKVGSERIEQKMENGKPRSRKQSSRKTRKQSSKKARKWSGRKLESRRVGKLESRAKLSSKKTPKMAS